MLVRSETGQADAEIGQWWTDFWQGDDHLRADLMIVAKSQSQESNNNPAKKRRRRNRSRVAKSSPAEQNN